MERDDYTVTSEDAEDDHGLTEGLYSKVESVAARCSSGLCADDYPLPAHDRSDFASFMALQVTRGQHFRGPMGDMTHQAGPMMLRIGRRRGGGQVRLGAAPCAPAPAIDSRHARWQKPSPALRRHASARAGCAGPLRQAGAQRAD